MLPTGSFSPLASFCLFPRLSRMQLDADGGGDGFATLATLENLDESTLTADNWLT